VSVYEGHGVTLHHADCLDVLRSLPDCSVDSVVTDPPYGLEFMGKDWDKFDKPTKGRADLTDHTNFTPKKSKFKNGVGTQVGMPKKNPRCRVCSRLKFDKPASKCSCQSPDWDTRTRENAQAFGDWCEAWATECLRVLKPGGHLLAFGGTRTWHRLACAVEDAGFDVRDSIAWLYGSGFPKSLDVSKAIDKMDATHERRARALRFTAWMRSTGITSRQVDEATGTNMGGHYLTAESQPAVATMAHLDTLRPLLPPVPEWVEEMARQRTVESQAFASREVVGAGVSGKTYGMGGLRGVETSTGAFDVTAPSTPDAERWQGWGTALKPAFEPVVVARKPLAGTVAANVLAHGTGALNIDGCRVEGPKPDTTRGASVNASSMAAPLGGQGRILDDGKGRWPANVVLDETQAVAIDEQSGESTSQGGSRTASRGATQGASNGGMQGGYNLGAGGDYQPYGDSGGASRFFYVAKADASERPRYKREGGSDNATTYGQMKKRECNVCGNRTCPAGGEQSGKPWPTCGHDDWSWVEQQSARDEFVAHPTVKPLDLMRWLVRLVTPPGGTVLEPFAGSGTTVEACIVEGFQCIAIEREADYLPLIRQRIDRRRDPVEALRGQAADLGLFDLLGGEGA